MRPDQMAAAEAEGIEKRFRLSTTLATSNMVCFDPQGRIKRYSSAEEILEEFYHLRLEYYQKRKLYLSDVLTQAWTKLDNKVRFIREVTSGKLIVSNRKKDELLAELESRGYQPILKSESGDEEALQTEARSTHRGFDYLLSMPIWSLTLERVHHLNKEKDEKEAELKTLLGRSAKDLWLADLSCFVAEWEVCHSGYICGEFS